MMAKVWYCTRCGANVEPSDATFLQRHDQKRGGCDGPLSAGRMRYLVFEQQPGKPASINLRCTTDEQAIGRADDLRDCAGAELAFVFDAAYCEVVYKTSQESDDLRTVWARLPDFDADE